MAPVQPRYTVTCRDCGWSAKTRHQQPAPRHKCPQCLSANLKMGN